jgi:DNA-binding transcriptional ArsR family regulator
MLDLLRERPGLHIAALGTHFAMSDVAVLKHVRVLEKAGLVISERIGRERHLYFNVMPIQGIYERWTDEYSEYWAGHIASIKSRVEGRANAKGAKRA